MTALLQTPDLRVSYKRIRGRERAKHAAIQSASDMYFRARVYSILRTVFVAALIGVAVAVLHRVA